MNIKLEIFAEAVSDAIKSTLRNMSLDTNEVIDTLAIKVLSEIHQVIKNLDIEDDFDVVEEIVCIFEKYNINAGGRHDLMK